VALGGGPRNACLGGRRRDIGDCLPAVGRECQHTPLIRGGLSWFALEKDYEMAITVEADPSVPAGRYEIEIGKHK